MIQKPVISAKEAVEFITTGDTIMVGGFMACGAPQQLLNALRDKGTTDMILISSDCASYNKDKGLSNGVAVNIEKKQFSKVIASHIGLNAEIQRQMIAGETTVILTPQGTLAEKIRSAGCGLGGFLTPTGVGTEVAEEKEVVVFQGKEYLLETPLPGDVALIHASVADKYGNVKYDKSARNFNPLMAMACKKVIVQADKIVEPGELNPEEVITPSIFVDYLVQTEEERA